MRALDQTMAPIVGYADPLAARPGDRVTVHASGPHGAAVARLVRLGHDGVSWTSETVAELGSVALAPQPVPMGSWGEIPDVPVGGAVSVWLRLTRAPETEAEIVSHGDRSIVVTAAGRLRCGALEMTEPLQPWRWYLVAAGSGWLAQRPEPLPWSSATVTVVGTPAGAAEVSGPTSTVVLGRGFDGKLARPAVHAGLLPDDLDAVAGGGGPAPVAAWDLGAGAATQAITGTHPGRFHQAPARAVTGPSWDGSCLDFRHAPAHYDAVHLHRDDLVDAEWPTTVAVDLPADLRSGAYAVELTAGDATDLVPFFVAPRERTAAVAVLLPTLTYLAYADEHLLPPLVEQADEVAARFGRANDIHSWYDRHVDGSQVVFASTRRPLLGVRPDHKFRYLGAEHGLSNDLRLLGWMERQGIAFDVITDHHLDADARIDHEVLVTGGHPEYWTARALAALGEMQARGGRLAHLGGNGFLWLVALDPERPWLAEMRRGQIENAPLDGESGEDHLQLTGHPAGMCRVVGFPETRLTGVATTAMGFGDGVGHVRTAASHDPRVAPIFAGIDSEVIGAFGPKVGAVGYEVDLANAFLGTPPHALVLCSTAVGDDFMLFAPSGFPGPAGEVPTTRRRADMVFYETDSGGAVFSVGSILWTSSLTHDGDDNDVSRLTANVLRWFAAGLAR